jgi:hypothetical protein
VTGDHAVRFARPVPGSFTRFNIVLATWPPVEAVVLHSAPTADEATIAFHPARDRLVQERVRGELQVVHHDDETRTVLREPLSTDPANPLSYTPRRVAITTRSGS